MRPVALLVILAMFLSLIPMWGAQAAVRSTPVGLVIGETEFLNLSTTVIWDNQSFSKSLNAQLKRSSCFVL